MFHTAVPHSAEPSLLKKELHCNFRPLWVKSSIECPVVHHCVEPANCLLRPIAPIHRHHLGGQETEKYTMNLDN